MNEQLPDSSLSDSVFFDGCNSIGARQQAAWGWTHHASCPRWTTTQQHTQLCEDDPIEHRFPIRTETFSEPLVSLWTESQLEELNTPLYYTNRKYSVTLLTCSSFTWSQLSPHSLQHREKKMKEPDARSSGSYKFLNIISPLTNKSTLKHFFDYVSYVYLKFLNL